MVSALNICSSKFDSSGASSPPSAKHNSRAALHPASWGRNDRHHSMFSCTGYSLPRGEVSYSGQGLLTLPPGHHNPSGQGSHVPPSRESAPTSPGAQLHSVAPPGAVVFSGHG
eukprot:3604949-Rhodomonas_salina.1